MLLSLLGRGLSVRTVAREMGISPQAAMRHARDAGYWRPEWRDRPKVHTRSTERQEKLKDAHRMAWKAFRVSGAEIRTKEYPAEVRNAYRWLLKHDRYWLVRNDPPAHPRWQHRA